MKRIIWLVLAIISLAISLPLLVWGFWPPRRETVIVPLVLSAGMPSLPEARTIHLTYSPTTRAGDAQIVEMKLTAEREGGDASVYEEYSVIAEARLDLPLADVRPAEMVSTSLVRGGGATFYWEVSPRQEGALRGTVWLYLRFVPRAGGEELRQPVSAQLVETRAQSVLGRRGSEARVAGMIGLVAALGLGIPFLRRRNASARKQAH